MISIFAVALSFAADKHKDQYDMGGLTYITHPLRLVYRLRTRDEELMSIAILHDVCEDRGVTAQDLKNLGMTQRVIDAVMLLTKPDGMDYFAYIERMKNNKDALLVKQQDLRDNMDATRMRGVSDKDLARIQKYVLAYAKVEKYLKDLEYNIN